MCKLPEDGKCYRCNDTIDPSWVFCEYCSIKAAGWMFENSEPLGFKNFLIKLGKKGQKLARWSLDLDLYGVIEKEIMKRNRYILEPKGKCVLQVTPQGVKPVVLKKHQKHAFEFVTDQIRNELLLQRKIDEAPKILHFNWMGPGRSITEERWNASFQVAKEIEPNIVCLWVSDLEVFQNDAMLKGISLFGGNYNPMCLILPFDYMFWGSSLRLKSPWGVLQKQLWWREKLILDLLKRNYVNMADIVRVINVTLYGGAYFDFGKPYERDKGKDIKSFWKCPFGTRRHLSEGDLKGEGVPPNDMLIARTNHPRVKVFVSILKEMERRLNRKTNWESINIGSGVNKWYFLYTLNTTGPFVYNPFMKTLAGEKWPTAARETFFPLPIGGSTTWKNNPEEPLPEYPDNDTNNEKLGEVLRKIKEYITVGYALRLYDPTKEFNWQHSTFFDRETLVFGKRARDTAALFINDVVDALLPVKRN
jgi:hypothetical protein